MGKKNSFDELIKKAQEQKITRRTFLKTAAVTVAALAGETLSGRKKALFAAEKLDPRKKKKIATPYDLSVISGPDPEKNTRTAVETLGGMKKFVSKGDVVVIKPNIGWDRTVEQAANTNPLVVASLVKMCREAGAKQVKVFDNTCNSAQRCYLSSGIAGAAKKAGADVSYMSDFKYQPGNFPDGSPLADWPVYRDAVKCDVLINVPVAKNHGITGLTLSLKNLMGVIGGNRGEVHWDIDDKLHELYTFFSPELTVVDATRILLRHGPTGGSLADVSKKDTVIAGTDGVLADAYAVTLFGMSPGSLGHIASAANKGAGSIDVTGANIKKIKLND